MKSRSILLLALSGLVLCTGCASTQNPKPAVCDGKHRRPANPYGSVLPTVPFSTPSAVAPSASPPAVPPTAPAAPAKPSPGPMSALDPKSFDPCGRPA